MAIGVSGSARASCASQSGWPERPSDTYNGYAAAHLPGSFQRDTTIAAADFTMSPVLSRLTVVVLFAALGTSFIQPLNLINLQARFGPDI